MKSISKDERERAVFRSRRMYQTDMESNRITAERRGEKRGFEIGEKHGIKIGEKRGLTIGEKRGLTIGEKQREADRKETARILKAKGLPVDVIAEATKLTQDEIERLDRPQDVTSKTPHKRTKR